MLVNATVSLWKPWGTVLTSRQFCSISSFAVRLFWCSHAVLVQSHPFYMTLNLQLSFFCPLCNNSTAHCPLLQYLHTTSAILAGAHSYFVVSSFKCEEFPWLNPKCLYVRCPFWLSRYCHLLPWRWTICNCFILGSTFDLYISSN